MSYLKKIWLQLTPERIKRAYIHDYRNRNYNSDKGFHRISFSQQGEDLALMNYFNEKPYGFYVDVGAYHPINFSNTNLFYKRGWRGLNIEPNPDALSLFKQLRSEDVNLNIAISEFEDDLTYYKFNFGAVNTFNEMHAKEWAAKDGFKIISTEIVRTYRLETVLLEHLQKNQEIDFMSVDVEGLDLNVLKSNNWEKYRPKILIIEEKIDSADSILSSEIINYLKSTDYSIWNISCGSVLLEDNRI